MLKYFASQGIAHFMLIIKLHHKQMNIKKSNDAGKPNRFGTNSDDEFEMGDSGNGGQPGCAQQ